MEYSGDAVAPVQSAALMSEGSREVSDTGPLAPVANIIATRRKKSRAVCGACLQEDSNHDGWMHRCSSCDVCVHAHCALSIGLAIQGNCFTCASCSLPEVARSSGCIICMRKLPSKTVCVSIPVTGADADVSLVHAPCLMLSRFHRLAAPNALPFAPSLRSITLQPTTDTPPSRCFICRAEAGQMLICAHASCGKLVHASCAADFKLVWLATARDYGACGDGPLKMAVACSMKHIKQDQVFCTCLRPYNTQGSTMVQCDDCRGWFHCDCLGIEDKEDELNELQSKQFRCSECAAKVSQAPPLHPPIFMCDVRRQWSHARVLLPPKSTPPSLDAALPLSNQHDAVSAIAADMLLLILRSSERTAMPDLQTATCIACLAPMSPHEISGNSVFSTLGHRLCIPCRSLRQSLLYLCVPAHSSSRITACHVHSKVRAIFAQFSDTDVACAQRWQSQ
jgi:hypothetical protein